MKILNTITLENTVYQASGNIVSNMNGEVVMLNVDNGKYYNLGEIGGLIWEKLKDPIKLRQLVSDILDEYDVKDIECEQQVLEFVNSLLVENLVIVK